MTTKDHHDDAKKAINHFNGWRLASGKKTVMATYRTMNYQKATEKNVALPIPPDPPQKRFKLFPKQPNTPPPMGKEEATDEKRNRREASVMAPVPKAVPPRVVDRRDAVTDQGSEFEKAWKQYIVQHPQKCSFQVVL